MSRVVKYDILRVAACFSIVLLHVSASYWSVVDVQGRDFLVMTVYNSVTRFAVPVFFMLSGLFLVAPERKNVTVGKRVLKLVLLFYVWSAFYAFQGIAVDTLRGEFSMEVFRAAVERFVFGHIHMWFLQILCGFYLLIPVARQISAKKETLRYYLILWIVFRFLVPTVTDAFGLTTFQARIDSLGLDILVGNFGYFLLGYYLSITDITKKVRWCIYAMGIVSLILTPYLTVQDCRKSHAYVERWFSPGSLNVLIMTIAVFVCFQYCKAFEQVRRVQLWGMLSRYTFFVYMFHLFVLEKLNLVGITTVSYPAVVSIPVMTVFIFTVSLFGAFVADHIPFVRKIVMLHAS